MRVHALACASMPLLACACTCLCERAPFAVGAPQNPAPSRGSGAKPPQRRALGRSPGGSSTRRPPCPAPLPPNTRSHFPRSKRDSAPSPIPNKQLKTSPASLITSPHGKIRLSPGPSSKVTPKNRAGAGAPCWSGCSGHYLGAIAAPRGQGTDGTEIRLAAVARVSGTGTGPCSIGPIAVPLGQIPPLLALIFLPALAPMQISH